MATDLIVKEGFSRRYLMDSTAPGGGRYNFTSAVIDLWIKVTSGEPNAKLAYKLTVDATGATTFSASRDGTALVSPAPRLFLGRPNPTDLSGPLIDTAATQGYITVEFPPEDSNPLVTNTPQTYLWAARVVLPNGRRHLLDEGNLLVEDSMFDL